MDQRDLGRGPEPQKKIEALLELTFCSSNERRKLFDCTGCKRQKARRCGEDRWDFTEEDNLPGQPIVWPLYVEKGGMLWGFCPAKATWDEQAKGVFRLLILAAKTGAMLVDGGLLSQPAWFLDLLSWFLPRLAEIEFSMKAQQVLGGISPRTQNGPK